MKKILLDDDILKKCSGWYKLAGTEFYQVNFLDITLQLKHVENGYLLFIDTHKLRVIQYLSELMLIYRAIYGIEMNYGS